jgi:hypothetical protein
MNTPVPLESPKHGGKTMKAALAVVVVAGIVGVLAHTGEAIVRSLNSWFDKSLVSVGRTVIRHEVRTATRGSDTSAKGSPERPSNTYYVLPESLKTKANVGNNRCVFDAECTPGYKCRLEDQPSLNTPRAGTCVSAVGQLP